MLMLPVPHSNASSSTRPPLHMCHVLAHACNRGEHFIVAQEGGAAGAGSAKGLSQKAKRKQMLARADAADPGNMLDAYTGRRDSSQDAPTAPTTPTPTPPAPQKVRARQPAAPLQK